MRKHVFHEEVNDLNHELDLILCLVVFVNTIMVLSWPMSIN